jgi:hypothetical protein
MTGCIAKEQWIAIAGPGNLGGLLIVVWGSLVSRATAAEQGGDLPCTYQPEDRATQHRTRARSQLG